MMKLLYTKRPLSYLLTIWLAPAEQLEFYPEIPITPLNIWEVAMKLFCLSISTSYLIRATLMLTASLSLAGNIVASDSQGSMKPLDQPAYFRFDLPEAPDSQLKRTYVPRRPQISTDDWAAPNLLDQSGDNPLLKVWLEKEMKKHKNESDQTAEGDAIKGSTQ
jgi:hypothetical protein